MSQNNSNHIANNKRSLHQELISRNTAKDESTQFHDTRESASLETNKYAPLDAGGTIKRLTNNLPELNKVYTASSSNYRKPIYQFNASSRNKKYVPELKQLSVTGDSNCTVQKKRKLYNPDDAGYINSTTLK